MIASGFGARVRRVFEIAIASSLIFSFAVFLVHVIEVPIVSFLIRDIIYAESKTVIDWGGWIRLAAPFENPNFLAVFLTMTLSYLLFFSDMKARFWFILLTVILLFLTGSRSGWVALTLVLALFYLEVLKKALLGGKIKPFLMATIVIGTSVVLLWNFGSPLLGLARVRMTVEALFVGGIMSEPHLAGRIHNFWEAMTYFYESPLLGWGSGKYAVMDIIDNQYATWLLRIGLFGFLLVIIFYSKVFFSQIKFAYRVGLTIGLFSFWGSVSLLLLTGAFLENFRIFFLFWIFVFAIWHHISEKVEHHDREVMQRNKLMQNIREEIYN